MKKLAALVVIIGGVAAAGYAASRLLDEEQMDELRDRAIDMGLDVASEAARIVEDLWATAQEKLGGGEIDVTNLDATPRTA
jgi:hypothetical protein